MSEEKKYLFVSYAHKDRKIVKNSIDALSAKGIRIWYDNGIKAGDDWSEKIGVNLNGASLMLLFLSKASIKSNNVRREIAYASEYNVPILTVQVGKIKLDDELMKKLAVNQFFNLKAQKTYGNFAGAVEKYIGSSDYIDENEIKEYKDKKIKIKSGIVWKILVLLLALIIGGNVVYNKVLCADAPVVIGMLTDPATERVTESGFEYAVGMDYTYDEEIGYIFDQNYQGKTLKKTQLVLTESLGPEENLTDVPSVVGYHVSEAVSKLVDAGMMSFVLSPVTTNEYQIAYVAAQSINAGYRVSRNSRIELSVSSEPDAEIEIFGQKFILNDKKTQVDVAEDGTITLTPLMLMSVDVDFSETTPISTKWDISATTNIKINVAREDTEPYGKFRGTFSFGCDVTGDSSVAWKAIEAVLAEDGKVSLLAESDSFNFKLEPWDEEKYSDFVYGVTHSKSAVQTFNKPIAMALVSDIPITNMNKGMSSVAKVTSYANMFSVAIPKVDGNILHQSYSIVIQENGKSYITLYSGKGTQRAVNYPGEITYDELLQGAE